MSYMFHLQVLNGRRWNSVFVVYTESGYTELMLVAIDQKQTPGKHKEGKAVSQPTDPPKINI